MPRILVAPDKFRDSLTATQAAEAIARGSRAAGAFVDICPVADGGEGTLDTLTSLMSSSVIGVISRGPMGVPVRAHVGVMEDGTGIVELAQSSGLNLVETAKRSPLQATTHGTGECIKAALARGAKRLVVGLGGSATMDAGIGMARSLGVGFYDRHGKPVREGIEALEQTALVDLAGLDRRLAGVDVLAACDVMLPLKGSAHAFGPQKGATAREIDRVEDALARFAGVFAEQTGIQIDGVPGGGAAGGTGAMLHALGARLESGASVVLEAISFRERMAGIDLVITGEGTLDQTSLAGKAAGIVASYAEEAGIPVVALVGANRLDQGPFKEVRSLEEHFGGDLREARTRAAAGLQAVAARLYSDLFH